MAKHIAGRDIKITFTTDAGEEFEMAGGIDWGVDVTRPKTESLPRCKACRRSLSGPDEVVCDSQCWDIFCRDGGWWSRTADHAVDALRYSMVSSAQGPKSISIEAELKCIHPAYLLGVNAMTDNPRPRTPLRHMPKKGDLGTITEGKSHPVPVRVTEDVPDNGDRVLVVPAKVESDDSPREVKLDEFTPKNAKAVDGLMAALVADVGVRSRVKRRTLELTQEASDEEFERRCRETVKRIAAKVKKRDADIRAVALKVAITVGGSAARAEAEIRKLIDAPRSITLVADFREAAAESEWREFIGQDFAAMGFSKSSNPETGATEIEAPNGISLLIVDWPWWRKDPEAKAICLGFIEKHKPAVIRGPMVRVDDDGTREVVDKVESWYWDELSRTCWVLNVSYASSRELVFFIDRDEAQGGYVHPAAPIIFQETRIAIAAEVAYKAGLTHAQAHRAALDFVNGVFQ